MIYYYLSDIDECSLGMHDCDQICVNIVGGFNCTCEEGYEILSDGRNCSGRIQCESWDLNIPTNVYLHACIIDIDECLENPCDENSECINTIGSFQCICDDGFVTNGPLTCRGMRKDVPSIQYF